MKKNFKRKKLAFIFGILALVLGGAGIFQSLPENNTAKAWECKDQNVISCGVNDRQDLANKITNGDGTHTDIKTIFNRIGIIPEDILSNDTVGGVVKKDGTVWVGSQMVASGVTMGFRPVLGVTGTPFAGLIWTFAQDQFDPQVGQAGAYVYMRNGQFKYAVLVSCGNPILQTLNAIPPHMQIEKTVRDVTTNPTGAFAKSVNANPGDTIEFKVKVINNGDITLENVNIGDYLPGHMILVPGIAKANVSEFINGSWQRVDVAFADTDVAKGKDVGSIEPGDSDVFTLQVKVGSDLPQGCTTLTDTGFAASNLTQAITDKANVIVCIQGPTPPTPVTPPSVTPVSAPVSGGVVPSKLPVSGPIEAAAGVLGTASLGSAGYFWRRSRKKLLDSLKNG